MSYAENEEFARVAIAEGFCTRAQIDRCLEIQSSTNEHLSLGHSLLREGFLTSEQYSRVLVLLRQGYRKERDTADARALVRQRQEDRVLAGIVADERWISAGQLKACQDEAARSARPLAEILVAAGHVEPARVEAILQRLERSERSCPSCGATLSVVRLPTADPVRCPRCGTVLPPVRP